MPKKGDDEFRDISDARMGNRTMPKWGTRLFTVRYLAALLQWRAIMDGIDISDGYHISLLTCCTDELVWGFGITGVQRVYEGDPDWSQPMEVGADGSFQPAPGPHGPQAIFEYGWRLHVCCWPCNCCQTCDKSLCGFFFDGQLARWAVAHFGQAPAGSPLNCIAMCLLRHAAMRGPAAGYLRSASSRSMHGVVWVDDFIFYHLVAWHAAWSGGCPTFLSDLAAAEEKDAVVDSSLRDAQRPADFVQAPAMQAICGVQRCALRLDRAAASANVDLLPYHVPGLTLVAEGIDCASRSGADFSEDVNVNSILGPAISNELWRLVSGVAVDAGWGGVTVDTFASESNARAPRFWSRFHEPGSKAIDALCVPDWARSVCPTCCLPHWEVLFLHPPSALVRATVEKACADSALCVLLVPVAILALHWERLLAA